MGSQGSALLAEQEEAWCKFCTPQRDQHIIMMTDERPLKADERSNFFSPSRDEQPFAPPLTVRKEDHHTQGIADSEAKIQRLESDHADLCKQLRSVGKLDKTQWKVLMGEKARIETQIDLEKKVRAGDRVRLTEMYMLQTL